MVLPGKRDPNDPPNILRTSSYTITGTPNDIASLNLVNRGSDGPITTPLVAYQRA